jgi:hypothetical protein
MAPHAMAQRIITQSGHCESTGPCTMQTSGPPGDIGIVSIGGAFALQEQTEVVAGHPYTAQAITEMTQTLSNGSHITQRNQATVGRDSKGRTFRVQSMNALGPWLSTSGGPAPGGSTQFAPTLTTIFDPVNRTHIDFTDNPKVAHILRLPGTPSATASVFRPAGPTVAYFGGGSPGGAGFGTQVRMDSQTAPEGREPEVEKLGEKTIEGVKVVGTRTSFIIPVNSIGNDEPLEITHETWYSPELGLIIESTQNDPRFGRTSYSLESISRAEPNEKLFQVPTGYRVEDMHPPMVP